MKPEILVTTRWEAARWCHDFDSVLTVFAPWWYCDWGHDDHMIVEFNDRVSYTEGAPTIAQADTILEWAHQRLDRKMLVHCKAGQSRSTAAAIGICVLAGMDEDEAWDHVHDACRPTGKVGTRPFIPNPRLLQHFDTLLGTELLDLSPRTVELGWAS